MGVVMRCCDGVCIQAIYKVSIFSVWGVVNITLLVSLPALLLTTITDSNVFWWLTGSAGPDHFHGAASHTLTAVQVLLSVCVAGCLEYRVVLYSFTPYLVHYAMQPVLATLLVTTAIFTGLAAFWLAVWGVTGSQHKSRQRAMVFSGCVYTAAVAGAISIGVSWYLQVFVLAAAYAALNFYFKRQFATYAIFVVSFTIALLFFIRKVRVDTMCDV